MKKLLFAALALLALASCSKENSGNTNPNGGESYAVLSIVQPTRAVIAAEPAECTIGDLTVYIFNASKALEQIETFSGAEIIAGEKIFKTTSGQHFFLVAANKPAGMASIALGENLASVEKKIFAVANQAGLDAITQDDDFFMTNLDGATAKSLAPGGTSVAPADDVTIKVGRAMAKVLMGVSNTLIQTNGTLKNSAAADIQYLVAANPVSMYTFPVLQGTQTLAPFFSSTLFPTVTATNYFPAIAATDDNTTLAFVNRDVAVYAVENTNEIPRYGNSSYLLITGTYAPAVWYLADGTVNSTAAVHGDDFYRIGLKNGNGRIESFASKIYSEALTAAEIEAELDDELGAGNYNIADYELVEYADGRTYYGLWLADNSVGIGQPARKYSVPRNNYFRVTINEITAPGFNTPIVVPDPDEPIESEAWIRAEIEISDWALIEQGGILGN